MSTYSDKNKKSVEKVIQDFKKTRPFDNTWQALVLNVVLIGFALMLGLLFLNYLYLPSHTHKNQTVTLPSLEKMTLQEVERVLTKAGLRYEVSDSSYVAGQPPFVVNEQRPFANTIVKPNRMVYLTINRSTAPLQRVPQVITFSMENALVQLNDAKFANGTIEYVEGEFVNSVQKIIIKGKEYTKAELEEGVFMPEGTPIDLVVWGNKAQSVLTLEDFVGRPLKEVESAIKLMELQIGSINYKPDNSVEKGNIISQSPAAGTKLSKNAVVDLWVSGYYEEN